jgi:hypothetical protein
VFFGISKINIFILLRSISQQVIFASNRKRAIISARSRPLKRGGLQNYIIRRLIYAALIAFGVVTITFVMLRLGPTSPADKYLANMSARTQDPSQVIAAVEARYGLLISQYTNSM